MDLGQILRELKEEVRALGARVTTLEENRPRSEHPTVSLRIGKKRISLDQALWTIAVVSVAKFFDVDAHAIVEMVKSLSGG